MDIREGQGTYRWPDGGVYVGAFKNGFQHGKKKKYLSKILGKGKKIYASGASYDGDWNMDKFDGFGTYRWSDGDFYVGNYKNSEKHGNLFFN